MMTFRSFATGHEVVQLLKERFHLKPPDGLIAEEHKIWTDKKQKAVTIRYCPHFGCQSCVLLTVLYSVINVLKSLILDGDLADQAEVLDEIAQFAASIISITPIARTLLVLVDRAVRGPFLPFFLPFTRALTCMFDMIEKGQSCRPDDPHQLP